MLQIERARTYVAAEIVPRDQKRTSEKKRNLLPGRNDRVPSSRSKDDARGAARAQIARRATVTGNRAARIAGGRPPAAPMRSDHTSPWAIRRGVTSRSNATWENVEK